MNKDHAIVEARAEYTKQLKSLVFEPIFHVIHEIYKDVLINTKHSKDNLINFQKHLQQIPLWNQSVIDVNVKKISNKCEFIDDLIAAIFISNVKILTSVKIGKDKKKIDITMPKVDRFLHKLFINSAKNVYENPHVFQKQDKKTHTFIFIENAVDETIRTMLPFQNILQSYLGKTLNESDSDSESEPEPEPESDSESEAESEAEPEPDFGSKKEDENTLDDHETNEQFNNNDMFKPPNTTEPEECNENVTGFFDKPQPSEDIKSVPIPNTNNINKPHKQMFFPDAADDEL